MKRGAMDISLKTLVVFIIYLTLLIALFYVVARYFIWPYLYPPPTDAQRDLKAIDRDVKDLIKLAASPISVPVPLAVKASYDLSIYPKDYANKPPDCKKEACICIDELTENTGQRRLTCYKYKDFDICPAASVSCGKQMCFKEYKKFGFAQGISSKLPLRKECNVIIAG